MSCPQVGPVFPGWAPGIRYRAPSLAPHGSRRARGRFCEVWRGEGYWVLWGRRSRLDQRDGHLRIGDPGAFR
jgi:hypothetical protein